MKPDMAGEVTGLLLEIERSELLRIMVDHESLKAKVEEAVAIVQAKKKAAAKIKKE